MMGITEQMLLLTPGSVIAVPSICEAERAYQIGKMIAGQMERRRRKRETEELAEKQRIKDVFKEKPVRGSCYSESWYHRRNYI